MQQLEPDMQQWTGSKLGKEYVKAVYGHSAYLTYKQTTSGFPGSSAGKESASREPLFQFLSQKDPLEKG